MVKNSYTSNGYYDTGRELHVHVYVQVMKRCEELVNKHNKELVNRLFDDVMGSALKVLVSNEPESDVEANVGK